MNARDIVPFSIVITRARSQASTLMEKFAAVGYYPVLMPTIGIDAVTPGEELKENLQHLKDGRFEWLVLTSPNGVRCLDRLLKQCFQTNDLPNSLQIAMIGPQSAAEFEELFDRKVDLIPQRHVSEGLLEALRKKKSRSGSRYFIGAARKTREVIVQGLRREGAEVTAATLYETVSILPEQETIERLRKAPADRIVYTFFSPSALKAVLKSEEVCELLPQGLIASIGPITSEAITACGLEVFYESKYQAEGQFIEGLIEALDSRPSQAYEESE